MMLLSPVLKLNNISTSPFGLRYRRGARTIRFCGPRNLQLFSRYRSTPHTPVQADRGGFLKLQAGRLLIRKSTSLSALHSGKTGIGRFPAYFVFSASNIEACTSTQLLYSGIKSGPSNGSEGEFNHAQASFATRVSANFSRGGRSVLSGRLVHLPGIRANSRSFTGRCAERSG